MNSELLTTSMKNGSAKLFRTLGTTSITTSLTFRSSSSASR